MDKELRKWFDYNRNVTSGAFSVEQLYQHFKDRLIAELRVGGHGDVHYIHEQPSAPSTGGEDA